MSDEFFVLDKDPAIFTGVPATQDDVLLMIADPESPVTPEVLDALPPEQRPEPEAIAEVLGDADA